MANKEIKFEVPALSPTDLETNAALVAEHKVLLERISEALDFFDDTEAKRGLYFGMLDLTYVLTPVSCWVSGVNSPQAMEESSFTIYVLAVADHKKYPQSDGLTRTIVLTAENQVSQLHSKGERSRGGDLNVQIKLDQYRTLRIDLLYSTEIADLFVGDYRERYQLRILSDATLAARVKHLREIAAALPK